MLLASFDLLYCLYLYGSLSVSSYLDIGRTLHHCQNFEEQVVFLSRKQINVATLWDTLGADGSG